MHMAHIIKHSKTADIILSIFSALLALQRKQRFIAFQLGIGQINDTSNTDKSANQSELSCLFVLNACGSLSIKELAEHLELDQSWLSRLSTSLIEKELVEFEHSKTDRRSKILKVSKHGLSVLTDSEIVSAKIVDQTFADLNKGNLKNLTKYIERFADGLEARNYKNNSSQNTLGYQLGRISVKTGIWGRGVLDTKLNLTQVHILELLLQNQYEPLPVHQFDTYMPYDASTLSRVLMVMEKNELLTKEQSQIDKRSVLYKPTDLGKRIHKELQLNVKRVFTQGLSTFSPEEIQEFLTLLEIAIGEDFVSSETQLKIVKTDELSKSDSQQIVNLTHNKSNKIESAGIIKSGKLVALIDIEYRKESKKIQSIRLRGQDLDKKLCAKMIEMVLNQ
jgi:DNA-binding MarR family transcriptional regulator